LSFAQAMAPGGPVEELVRLRDESLAAHLGVAGGPVGMLLQYVRTDLFEVVLTHNRYTLLDRTAEPLIAEAHGLGLGVVLGAPFGGGVLAKGLAASNRYAYRPMAPDTRRRVEALSALCAEAGVPLGAAALQFGLRDGRISSTVVGVTHPERIAEIRRWATWPIEPALWRALTEASGLDSHLDNSSR
jgi:D-threo-aldose 1-dehydrogenase